MNKINLIIDALQKAKDGWQCFDEYEKAIAAARELKALAQPEREWVGLTGREIEVVLINSGYTAESFARAIEAKLKERNT